MVPEMGPGMGSERVGVMEYTSEQIEALDQIASEILKLDEDVRYRLRTSDYADWANDCDAAEEYARKFVGIEVANKWSDLAARIRKIIN